MCPVTIINLTLTAYLAYLFHVEQTQRLAQWSSELGVQLSDDKLALFNTYLSELTAWNKKINLTAITEPQHILIKHFLDSILYSKGIVGRGTNSELLDIGSGAGFPGLPLKIVYPDLSVTLLEPTAKKIAFLRHLIGTLGLTKIKAIPQTLQSFAADNTNRKVFSYIVTRALNIRPMVDHCLRLLAGGGRLILSRSKVLEDNEMQDGLEVENAYAYELPYEYGCRVLTILRKSTS